MFWPLQDIFLLNGLCARINNMLCKHPSVWAPHPPTPSSPTLLRNILFPPDPPCIAIYILQDWEWQYLIKAKVCCTLG